MEEIRQFASHEKLFPFAIEIRHIPIKRLFDILFSLTCLIVGSPLFLLISLFIFITSPGKIIYSQERIGRGGKPFRCYKFRSMYVDADQRLNELFTENPTLKKRVGDVF